MNRDLVTIEHCGLRLFSFAGRGDLRCPGCLAGPLPTTAEGGATLVPSPVGSATQAQAAFGACLVAQPAEGEGALRSFRLGGPVEFLFDLIAADDGRERAAWPVIALPLPPATDTARLGALRDALHAQADELDVAAAARGEGRDGAWEALVGPLAAYAEMYRAVALNGFHFERDESVVVAERLDAAMALGGGEIGVGGVCAYCGQGDAEPVHCTECETVLCRACHAAGHQVGPHVVYHKMLSYADFVEVHQDDDLVSLMQGI